MQIHNNTLIAECSSYDFKEMLERTENQSNLLPGKAPQYQTESISFYTTFYNLNWGENGRIPIEEVANRVNSSLEKFGVNGESSVKKFGVNAEKFGDTSETQKTVSKTAQKIIDLVISDPSITADNMANKIGVTKRAIEKNIKKLRDMGILVHEGSDKNGYWRIIVNS